jgi:hypothetical protein
LLLDAVFSWDFSVASPRYWRGFFIYAQPRVEGSCPTASITL